MNLKVKKKISDLHDEQFYLFFEITTRLEQKFYLTTKRIFLKAIIFIHLLIRNHVVII
jgi:hypothetical protein